MNTPERNLGDVAIALREAFDRSFAEAPVVEEETLVDLLTVRVGGDPYALLLSEVGGLHAGRKIVPIPSSVSGLLGLASTRGVVVPVYDLGVLLGYAPTEGPRWLAIVRADEPVAIAFEVFEAHRRVPLGEISDAPDTGAHGCVRSVLREETVPRPIVSLGAIIDRIASLAAGQT